MLQVRLRNSLLLWPDPVVDARVYVNPPGGPYPQPGNKAVYHQVSNANGGVNVDVAGLMPGNHRLLILPKHATSGPVGPATAVGIDANRIFRDLKVRFTVDGEGRVTSASVHPDTQDNGTVALQSASTKNPILDVRLRPAWIQSPFHYPRNQRIDMIVVHKTGDTTIGPAINQFLNGGTSIHYLVDRDGHVVKMVLDEHAAGHASNENNVNRSRWGSQSRLAWRSIGIENVGTTSQGMTDPQYQSLIRLIQELMRTHGIPRHRVVGHSDILTDGQGHLSDERIACPGRQFEWSRLESANIGLARAGGEAGNGDPVSEFFAAMQRANGSGTLVLRPGDFDSAEVAGKLQPARFGGREYKDVSLTPIKQLQSWLAEIGYSVGPANGQFNRQTARAVRHFQVHFEGRSNNETVNDHTASLIRAVRLANPRAD